MGIEMSWIELTKQHTRGRVFLSPYEDEVLFIITPGSLELREEAKFITLTDSAYSTDNGTVELLAPILSKAEIKEKYGIEL